MQGTTGTGPASSLHTLATLAAGIPSTMQSLLTVALDIRDCPPRDLLVDPDPSSDDMPLTARRVKIRARAREEDDDGAGHDGKAPASDGTRRPKKPKAVSAADGKAQAVPRQSGPRPKHLRLGRAEQIPIDMAQPLGVLLHEWVTARVPTALPAQATPLWSMAQLEDAVRRRVMYDNPKLGKALLRETLHDAMNLMGRLQGQEHERAATALCRALGTRGQVARMIGETLVREGARLGDQLGPTLRLAVRLLGEPLLIVHELDGLERRDGQRSRRGPHRDGKPDTLVDEAVRTRPRLVGTIWRALIGGLQDRGDVPAIGQVVKKAVQDGGPGWQSLPVLFEALGAAGGGQDMPVALLESSVHLLLEAPWIATDGAGTTRISPLATQALRALCWAVSTRGWNPEHQVALRRLWQAVEVPAAQRELARVLEPALHDAHEAPRALATQVRESLAASEGMAPDRLVARVIGPLLGFLERPGLDADHRRSLVAVLCANLAPGMATLTPGQSKAILDSLGGAPAGSTEPVRQALASARAQMEAALHPPPLAQPESTSSTTQGTTTAQPPSPPLPAPQVGAPTTTPPPGTSGLPKERPSLQVERDEAALRALVTGIAQPAIPAHATTAMLDHVNARAQAQAQALREQLQRPGVPPTAFSTALAALLDVACTPAPATPAQGSAYKNVLRAALSGLIGGVPGLPAALATAASMPLLRQVRLMGLLVRTDTVPGPKGDALQLEPKALKILQTLVGVPGVAAPRPGFDRVLALRMTLALAFSLINRQAAQGINRQVAALNLMPIFRKAIPAISSPIHPASPHIGLLEEAASLALKPWAMLVQTQLRPREAVDLLCELYELPATYAPPDASRSLADLVSQPLPAHLKLAGAARLVRAIAPTLKGHELFAVRRQLTEVIRGMALDIETALPAQRDAARQRHAQAIDHLREVYAQQLRLPLMAQLLTPGPIDPRSVGLSAANLRAALSDLEAEIAELTRTHQPPWVVTELLPIAGQSHEAVLRALEIGQAAGTLPAKAATLPSDE